MTKLANCKTCGFPQLCECIDPKRFRHKDNNATYSLLVDFGDEVCMLREDINIRMLYKLDQFKKYFQEIK
jgi:hypothetical protein